MPDDPDTNCPPDAESNTPEAPAPRSVPLQHSDTADAGCLLLLLFMFIGVFLLPALFLLGGAPLIMPLITVLLLVIVTPIINPLERSSSAARWWGRVLTFCILAGLVVAAWFWIRGIGETMSEPDS